MKLKCAMLSLAMMAVVVVPAAAQAGTKAGTSTIKFSGSSGFGMRKSSWVKSKQNAESGLIIAGFVGAAMVAGGVIGLTYGDGNKSNGA